MKRRLVSPNFTLLWFKTRNSLPVVVAWTVDVRRAVTIAYRLEWGGWFAVTDSVGEVVEPFFRV